MFENAKIIQSTFTQQERDLMGLDDELEQQADSVTCFYEKINDVPVSYFELAEYRTHLTHLLAQEAMVIIGTRGMVINVFNKDLHGTIILDITFRFFGSQLKKIYRLKNWLRKMGLK